MNADNATPMAHGAESASTAGLGNTLEFIGAVCVSARQNKWEQWSPVKNGQKPTYQDVWDAAWNAAILEAAMICDNMNDVDYHVEPNECSAAIRLLIPNAKVSGAGTASAGLPG